MYYGLYKNLRDGAWKTLLDNNISSLPVDVASIAQASDIKLIKDSDVNILLHGEHGRVYCANNEWFIVYNEKNPTDKSRYTVAHELGHIFLGHNLALLKYGKAPKTNKKPKSEQQADMFAERLLCPACVLWALNLKTPEEIARVCGVPLDVAKRRAKRMEELYKRNKFITSPLEESVFKLFNDFIRNMNGDVVDKTFD
jgi:Zn-dependent peptidase ImmA (M78 family)